MADRFSILVNNVADALSKEECRTLLYLCSDLLSGECVEDFPLALLTLATNTHTGQSQPDANILMELLFQLKRFDILKRVLGTSKQEVEQRLRDGGFLSKYRVLMMELGENLDAEELNSFIFLIRSTVPKGILDRAKSFLDVVVELEKLDEVSCENLGLVEECLTNIRRVDLAKRVQQFQRGQHVQVSQNPEQIGTKSSLGLNHSQQQGHAQAFETLKTSIPESGMQYIQGTGDDYNINCELRGLCVIIDCIGCDGVLLKHTFEQLGFQVFLHTMLTVEEMHSVLRTVSQQRDLQWAAAFICCLLSRSSDTHLLATDPCGPGLLLTGLLQLFSPVQCPLLRGKPKLFFTQSYIVAGNQSGQGHNDQYLETDAMPIGGVPRRTAEWEDVLWSMCKTGAWLLERQDHQSFYLQALSTALLQARSRRLHILDALTKMNRDVYEHNQKNPDKTYNITLSHTLRKSLYL
ncbi:CASP8 and FADD-like apoptosis regulator a [Electrophorus electricus]|uniref:CASP8 and FADD-like apoptosis regulator a n=1 Tax=Electrophorus electricus TaxID=8005 RepID=UPI000F0A7D5C|nr:CASP8 and FADD-like apoptosis regulator a [Electrophorus electricus]